MNGTPLLLEPCRSAAAALLSAGTTCWTCAGERVLLPAWLTLANYMSLLLYVLLLFERVTEVIFHLAACLLPAFVYVLLALLVSVLSLPPEASPEGVTHEAGAGVAARPQALAQQQLRSPVVRIYPSPADASATAARSSIWSTAELSFLRKSRRRRLTERRYPFAAAAAASLLPSSRADGPVSVVSAGFDRVVPQYENGGGSKSSFHSGKSTPSDSLTGDGLSTVFRRMRSSSSGETQKLEVKKHLAALRGVTDMFFGYTWKRRLNSWRKSSSFSSRAYTEVGEGGATAYTSRVATGDTSAREGGTATVALHRGGPWPAGLHRIAAASTSGGVPAAPVSACGEPASIYSGKVGPTSHNAGTDEEHNYGRDADASAAPGCMQSVPPSAVTAAKATQDAECKQRMKERAAVRVAYEETDAQAPAGEGTTRRDGFTGVGGVAGEARQQPRRNTGTQQPGHAGAQEAADIATGETESETGSAREKEEEGVESEGSWGETWLGALLAVGYIIISSASRFLLLELPVYSFALYLCQVLRVQGISFSAGPSSTLAAADEVAAYRRVLFATRGRGEQASPPPQSTMPSNASSASNTSSSALSHDVSSSSSSSTTSCTTRSNGSSRCISRSGRHTRNSSRCIRPLRCDDCQRPNPSKEGTHSLTGRPVQDNGVLALCSEEFGSQNVRSYDKSRNTDIRASTVAGGAIDDNPGYARTTWMVSETGAASAVTTAATVDRAGTEDAGCQKAKAGLPTAQSLKVEQVFHTGGEAAYSKALVRSMSDCRRTASAAALNIKHIWGSGELQFPQTDERSEGRYISRNSWDDCSPTFVSDQGVHLDSELLYGDAAGKGSEPAAGGSTAVGAAAVGIVRGCGRVESVVQRGRETHIDKKVSAGICGYEATAGTHRAGGIGRREDNTDGAALEGEGVVHAAAGGEGQTTFVTAAAETQCGRLALPAMEKEVETVESCAGAAMKTAGQAPAGTASEERRRLISRRNVLAADAPPAKLGGEPALLAVSRPAAPKPSAAAQACCTRGDTSTLVKASENETHAACACITDAEGSSAAVREGTEELPAGWELPRLVKETQREGEAVPAASTRGCSALHLPLVAKETENVEDSCGCSSGTEVVAQRSLEYSDTTGDRNNHNEICTAGVVQVETGNTCQNGSEVSTEDCCVSSGQGCKRIGFVPSERAQGGAQALCESAAPAAAETPEVDNREATTAAKACSTHGAPPNRIALLLWSVDKLQSTLRPKMLGGVWRWSYLLTADISARFVQSMLLWIGFQGKLLRALHPFRLLSLSPIHLFPNSSQRLIFTTCCFWLLRGLHGDIFFDDGTSPSPARARASGSSVDGWAGSDAVSPEPSTAFIRRDDYSGSTGATSVRVNNRDGIRSSSHARGSRNQRRRNDVPWGGGPVVLDIFRLNAESDPVRASPPFQLYSSSARDTLPTVGTPRGVTRVKPSFPLLEKAHVIISGGSRHSRPQRARQKGRSVARSLEEEYRSSRFQWVYPFLLKPFKQAREYLQPLRQWTAWLALLLLLLLLISYSLLSLSSTYENLPWQLLHVLVVLRHTRLCTYAERVVKHPKLHLLAKEQEEGARRFSGAVRRQQDLDEKRHDEQALQTASQAQELVESDVLRRSGHQPKGEDGVDEKTVCIFCFEAFISTDVLRLVNACGHIFHRTSELAPAVHLESSEMVNDVNPTMLAA